MIETLDLKALHVEAMRLENLHAEHDPGVLFQASTIDALLDGAYEGQISFAELSAHGDCGLGTLDALDGEMIALDGRFYRADLDGRINEIGPDALTPFAVIGWLAPGIKFRVDHLMSQSTVLAEADDHLPAGSPSCLIRIDGEFESIKARSVPRQEPPFRPLAEVVADQHVFDMPRISGTMIGFRFPAYAEGIEVAGYHLHFIDTDRTRGGHVLDFEITRGNIVLDPSSDLHVELPPGIDLTSPTLSSGTHAAIERIER